MNEIGQHLNEDNSEMLRRCQCQNLDDLRAKMEKHGLRPGIPSGEIITALTITFVDSKGSNFSPAQVVGNMSTKTLEVPKLGMTRGDRRKFGKNRNI